MQHPILGYLTDMAEIQLEVDECRDTIEWQLGYAQRVLLLFDRTT